MSTATTPKPAIDTGRPAMPPPKLNMTVGTEASERFRALPLAERKRRLGEFREALGRAFADTPLNEYLGERRRESARES